jgi:tetratricopeptide (TPR) repeat protein
MSPATLFRTGWTLTCLAAAALAGVSLSIDRRAKAALAGNDPVEAARLDSRSAQALSRAAAKVLAEGNPLAAAEAARQAIALAPLSQRSVAVLGIARIATNGGTDVLRLGRDLGWREPAAQLWLLGLQLQEGNEAAAMEHADALFRQSTHDGPLLPDLRRLAEGASAAEAVAARLALRPPWRTDFLTKLDALDRASVEGHARILSALGQTAAPPNDREAASFVRRLINLDDETRAQRAWRDLMNGRGTSIGDPDFRHVGGPGTYGLFAWHAPPLPGLKVTESNGIIIRVDGPSSGTILSQTLLLAPGQYSFSVEIAGNDASPESTFSWTVRCAQSGKRIDFAAARLGSGKRQIQSVRFQVPASCPVQSLNLHVAEDTGTGAEIRLNRATIGRVGKTAPIKRG